MNEDQTARNKRAQTINVSRCHYEEMRGHGCYIHFIECPQQITRALSYSKMKIYYFLILKVK